MMKERIKENINDPEKLEQLYRDDRSAFESGFGEVYAEIEKSELSEFWKIRLDYFKVPDRAAKKIFLPDILFLLQHV